MKAIILAGGFGRRLGNLTLNTLKPMLEISNKPFISYLLDRLSYFKINEVILCIHYQRDKFKQYFSRYNNKLKITFSEENKPLGTGGAIKNALKFVENDDPFLIMNGDSDLIKKNTQCLICEISFFSPYSKTKGITKIFDIVEKLGLHFYSFLDFKFRSTKKIPKKTRIGRERIMQADAIFFKDPLFTFNNHVQRQVKINFLSALIFGFYDYCLELLDLIGIKKKEKGFLEKLIFQLGNIDLNYIRNETKKFRDALNEKNLNAILELGKIVDERRDFFSYDDLIKK